MTYTTASNLVELTEYLSAFILEKIGITTIATPLFEEIREILVNAIPNGIEAFCGGASPSGLRYEVEVTAEDADKPIVFEQWRVSAIREEIESGEYSSTDLPTLFRMNDEQFREVLEHCVRKGYSFYCSIYGMMLDEFERIAKDYFEK
jgi:hypothetical protein